MKLLNLIGGLRFEKVFNIRDIEVEGITKDSRQVKNGYVFFLTEKNEKYLKEALTKGACAFVTEKPINVNSPLIIVNDVETFFARIASRFYGEPSKKMKVIGITGTNGKTTTTYLLESIFTRSGTKVGIIGTINYRYNGKIIRPVNTTPGADELQSLFFDMLKEGVEVAVMEVSSHALDQKRVESVDFDCAVFTNLTHDHLDYHGTQEAYKKAKSLLFHHHLKESAKKKKFAVLNLDDPNVSAFVPSLPTESLFFSTKEKADVFISSMEESLEGIRMEIIYKEKGYHIESSLIGGFNAENILAAFLTASVMGIPEELIIEGIKRMGSVPGRLERVKNKKNVFVFVDYAHTPDALQKVLLVLKRLKRKRLIVVFGCGGERDSLKRPIMGKVASLLSDFAIITSDNPRHEDPRIIIEQIKEGFEGKHCAVIEDRREAINEALRMAQEEDIVLIAGKGHEDYQLIGDFTIPFADKRVVEEFFNVEY